MAEPGLWVTPAIVGSSTKTLKPTRLKIPHMSRKDTVRLFDVDGRYQCHISPSEAEEMFSRGEVEDCYEDRNGSPHYIGIKRRGFSKTNDGPSPTSLTKTEMEANVGITPGEGEARRGMVTAAQLKVRLWPYVGDTKAVRVGISR